MFYLILAILTSAMISIFMRLSAEKVKGNFAMLAVSYLTSTLISACYMERGSLSALPEAFPAAAMAAVNGCLYVGGLVLMQRNIPRHGVVLTSTYMRLGPIVCVGLSVLLFREIPSALQTAGFVLAVAAIVFSSGLRRSGDFSLRPGLLLMLLVSGLGDTWVKLFGSLFDNLLSDAFLMTTFVVAALLCLGLTALNKQAIGFWELLFGIAVAVPNYFNSRFLLKSLQTLPGIIVYPTFSVATLLLITLLGVFLFQERLGRRQGIAMAMILVSLALLNL